MVEMRYFYDLNIKIIISMISKEYNSTNLIHQLMVEMRYFQFLQAPDSFLGITGIQIFLQQQHHLRQTINMYIKLWTTLYGNLSKKWERQKYKSNLYMGLIDMILQNEIDWGIWQHYLIVFQDRIYLRE